MSYAYSYGIIGYPQTSAMVSTAYVDKDFDGDGAGDGYVFIYLPYNYTPGGISVLMDRPARLSRRRPRIPATARSSRRRLRWHSTVSAPPSQTAPARSTTRTTPAT